MAITFLTNEDRAELEQLIRENGGSVSTEQIAAAVEAYMSEHPADGLTTIEKNIILTLFENAAYINANMKETFKQLKTIWHGESELSEVALLNNMDKSDPALFTTSLLKTYNGQNVVPVVMTHGFNSENATTTLSGKTITKITLKIHTPGVISVGRVDLTEWGKGIDAELIEPQLINAESGIFTFDVDIAIGEHETLGIQSLDDTGALAYHTANYNSEMNMTTNIGFKTGSTTSNYCLYGTIYGLGIPGEEDVLDTENALLYWDYTMGDIEGYGFKKNSNAPASATTTMTDEGVLVSTNGTKNPFIGFESNETFDYKTSEIIYVVKPTELLGTSSETWLGMTVSPSPKYSAISTNHGFTIQGTKKTDYVLPALDTEYIIRIYGGVIFINDEVVGSIGDYTEPQILQIGITGTMYIKTILVKPLEA